MLTRLLLVAIASLGFTNAATAFDCPEDIDGDGLIGFADLLIVLSDWGPCSGCPGDIDGSGAADFEDLLGVLAAWGPCLFDYGPERDDQEALQIGLEILGADGELILNDFLYDRIDRDLDLIRAAEPLLAAQFHTPAWLPTDLIVKKIPEADTTTYDALNACLQLVGEDHLFADWYVLTFPAPLNANALVGLYTALESIEFAEPNGISGGENFWFPVGVGGGVWRWSIDDGFFDCFDGCDCHRLYTFETDDDGNVTFISLEEIGAEWCEF